MSSEFHARKSWLMVGLLFAFMLINFLDKTVIGLAAVPIMTELHLTHLQFGAISSSFFYLFSISAITVGFLANRYPSKWLLSGMALVWGVSQLPMFGVVGAPVLVASRILLGAGEGPAYPIAVHAIHKWFPDERRALPAAIIGQGPNVGIVLILPLLNWVLIHYSWHMAFGALGLLAFVWMAAWQVLGREGTYRAAAPASGPVEAERIPYARLLLNRTILGTWAASFGAYWGLSLLVAWFTPYLVQGLGVSQARAGFLSVLPWGASILLTVAGAALSERLTVKGVSTRITRGVLPGTFVAVGGLCLIALPHAPVALKLPLLVVGLALPALIYALGTAIGGEIAPAGQRGAVLAIGSAVSTSAGLIAPAAMGGIIDHAVSAAAGYESGFVINGVITLVGGLLAMLLINPPHTRAALRKLAAPAG